MDFGVTDTGFVLKSFSDIMKDIENQKIEGGHTYERMQQANLKLTHEASCTSSSSVRMVVVVSAIDTSNRPSSAVNSIMP